jgi:hypothetical protein
MQAQTFDLGWEQMLILADRGGERAGVMYRGLWLAGAPRFEDGVANTGDRSASAIAVALASSLRRVADTMRARPRLPAMRGVAVGA